jgi:hypothetical protein
MKKERVRGGDVSGDFYFPKSFGIVLLIFFLVFRRSGKTEERGKEGGTLYTRRGYTV